MLYCNIFKYAILTCNQEQRKQTLFVEGNVEVNKIDLFNFASLRVIGLPLCACNTSNE